MSNPYGWGQNEPQIKPKDQGGDTIATFSQKIYNLFDNLFNTLNSYPWSAATQSDAGYMSAADKTALDNVPTTYLPRSGGAITDQIISRNVTNSALRLMGGSNNENGAYLNLWGKDSSEPGLFNLIARKTTPETAILTGTPEGALTWRSFNLPYCFTGSATNKSRGDFINFAVSPPKTPSYIYVFHPSTAPSSMAAYGISKTGFYLGTTITPVDNVYYIAFCLGGGNS